MPKIHLVTQADDKTWGFACPHASGCGRDGVPFSSTGWGTKTLAQDRGRQHLAEHNGEGTMQTLDDFRTERGLTETTATQDPSDWVL